MKHLVIFDLDGTLLNTIADLAGAANHALRVNGYPQHSLSAYPMFVGNGITRLIERALPEECRTDEVIERVRADFMPYYDAHCADLTEPYPGIHHLLRALTERNVKVAVASNKYQQAVEQLVRKYFPDIPWAAIEGAKEGVPSKPDPSIVFEILSKVPTRKSKVLYVGDSGIDMVTARRACVDSCGVTWGFRSVRELKEAYADSIVTDPAEVLAVGERPGLDLDSNEVK